MPPLFRLFRLLHNATHHLLELWARQHDEMAAALAFQPEIHARAGDLTLMASAGMRLLHAHDVTDIIMHFFHCVPFLPRNRGAL